MEPDVAKMLATLARKGANRSESLSDSEYSMDVLAPENPIRVNLTIKHDKYIAELLKSPLVERQEEIISNYDIFLNCIYWQVKGLRGRGLTRKTAAGIRDSYYQYIGKAPPPLEVGTSVGITGDDMLCLDSEGEEALADHDTKFRKYKIANKAPSEYSDFPLPPPSKRLTRRNSTGPFFHRSDMEKMFASKNVKKIYNMGSLIAKGAFGRVYLATSPTDEAVAIKSTDLKADPTRIHNIAIEIHLMVLAEHPNVVKHIESFYWENEIWSVLEFCNGGAITSFRKVTLTENQIRFLMLRLLSALNHMHNQKIIHRDLKCANIMLKIEHGIVKNKFKLLSAEPKIGDFGLSGLHNSERPQSAMCGSRYWMSPEMIQRVGYSYKTDIYSMGCVMYELMTGRAPYRKEGGLVAIFCHATKGCDPLPPAEQEYFSVGCRQFLAKLTEPDQHKRLDAEQLLRDKWLNKTAHLPTVLCDPLNTAYDNRGPFYVESILRPQFRTEEKKATG